MKLLLECHDMDAAGALYNALRENLVGADDTKLISMISDRSGHNWVTGWFVSIEVSTTKKAPSSEEAI